MKQLFEYVERLFFLARDVQEDRADIQLLQSRVEDLTEKVRALAFEIQRISEREQHEREKLALKIENTLLRFERLLPPPPESKKRR